MSKPSNMRDVAELARVSFRPCRASSTRPATFPPRRARKSCGRSTSCTTAPTASPDHAHRPDAPDWPLILDITNPVPLQIASAVESAAYARGYKVVLYNVGMSAERERECLHASAEGWWTA